MEQFSTYNLQQSFGRLQGAAAKGHEESIWIVSVLKAVEMEKNAWKEAFAKTEEPLGWYFAGYLSDGREQFDFYKKSAEGGCSWGQLEFGEYFESGDIVEPNPIVRREWLEKAANQNNPCAMCWLGDWFRHDGNDKEKAVSYYRAGAELGWKKPLYTLMQIFRYGEGCVKKDLGQAAICSAKGGSGIFWLILREAREAFESRTTNDLDCDFNQLCYALGWGLYWCLYRRNEWNSLRDELQTFGQCCFDFYVATLELEQESIFTFLLFWNRTVGVKDAGVLIGKMVWKDDPSVRVKQLW
jgi:hypothetical protein